MSGPSNPTQLLLNGGTINTGVSHELGTLDVRGRQVMVIEVITDQALTLALRGTGNPEPAGGGAVLPGMRHIAGGADVAMTALAVGAGSTGVSWLVDVRGYAWLRPLLTNASGSTATVTCRVTLE
jgi:hypothetical protein